MSKYVYKLIPCNKWQIGETESWLSDMAEEGLILKKFGLRFAKFEKSEPTKIRYRLDYYPSFGKMSSEQILSYEESGWKLSSRRQKFYIFSAPADSSIPELHTDASEQGYSLKNLNTRLFITCILNISCFILLLFLFFLSCSIDGTYYLNLLNISFFYSLLFAIPFCTFLLFLVIIEYISINKLKKSLIEGNPIIHNAHWKPTGIINPKMELYTILVFSTILFILYLFTIKNSTDLISIPLNSYHLPIVTLSEIEEYPYIEWNNQHLNKIENTNWYTKGWTPLAPYLLRSGETGIVKDSFHENADIITKMSGNTKYVYMPSIYTQVYQVKYEAMTDNVLLDLVKTNKPLDDFKDSLYVISPIENEDFDLLYTDKINSKIFASRGRGIIYVNYNGDADLDKILEVISEKLKLIE